MDAIEMFFLKGITGGADIDQDLIHCISRFGCTVCVYVNRRVRAVGRESLVLICFVGEELETRVLISGFAGTQVDHY